MTDCPSDHKPFPPAHAAAITNALWDALGRRDIPRTWHTVLECLLWRCRVPGRDRCSVSITELRARTGVQRQHIVDAISYAVERGWLERIKRNIRVWCEALRHYKPRQAVNVYVWLPPANPANMARETVLTNYKKIKARMLREDKEEVRKNRPPTTMDLAHRLRSLEKANPAILVVIGEAVQMVLEAPKKGFAELLASVPMRASFQPPTKPQMKSSATLPAKPASTPVSTWFDDRGHPPTRTESLLESIRRKRFA